MTMIGLDTSKSVFHAKPASGDDAAELETIADELKADIVVAGAYGHSR